MPPGRPKGSNGIVSISVQDLMERLTPQTLVPVKTSFARQLFPDKLIVLQKDLSRNQQVKEILTKEEPESKIMFNVIQP